MCTDKTSVSLICILSVNIYVFVHKDFDEMYLYTLMYSH
jgi:hypothetical protein